MVESCDHLVHLRHDLFASLQFLIELGKMPVMSHSIAKSCSYFGSDSSDKGFPLPCLK